MLVMITMLTRFCEIHVDPRANDCVDLFPLRVGGKSDGGIEGSINMVKTVISFTMSGDEFSPCIVYELKELFLTFSW